MVFRAMQPSGNLISRSPSIFLTIGIIRFHDTFDLAATIICAYDPRDCVSGAPA